jgi:hypothetical protein
MNIPNKKWLDSLIPIREAADNFTKGDENLCRQRARINDSLVTVGTSPALFVDANRFLYFEYLEMAERAARQARAVLHLRDGHLTAADLQDEIQKAEVKWYESLSRIAALREAEAHSTDAIELAEIEKEAEGLRIQLPGLERARNLATSRLDDLVTQFGFTPPVEIPAPLPPAPTRAKAVKKTTRRSAVKKVNPRRSPGTRS